MNLFGRDIHFKALGLAREGDAPRVQSESMQRHPYSWEGVDKDGAYKSGSTLMRDRTTLDMVEGFGKAGYRAITITREESGGPPERWGNIDRMHWATLQREEERQA